MKLLPLLLLLSATVCAQATSSFRSLATGGLLEDDLDLVTDGIGLHFVEGMRLYTNLGNLTSSDEELLDNDSDGKLLFGVSAPRVLNNKVSLAVLGTYRNRTTPESVHIDADGDGLPEQVGVGELTTRYFNSWDASGGLGPHSREEFRTVHARNTGLDRGHTLVLLTSMEVGEGVGSLRFQTADFETSDSRSPDHFGPGFSLDDPSGSIEQGLRTLPNGNLLSHQWTSGDFLTTDRTRSTGMVFSLMLPSSHDRELRLDAGVSKLETERESGGRYEDTRNTYVPDSSHFIDLQSTVVQMTSGTLSEQTQLKLGASLRQRLESAAQRKNESFWQVGGFASYGLGDVSTSDLSTTTNREEDRVTHVQPLTSDSDWTHVSQTNKGDRLRFQLGLDGRLVKRLDDRVRFGLGCSWFYSRDQDDTRNEYSYARRDSTLLHDGIDSSNDEYTWSHESSRSDVEDTVTESTLAVPVGLEVDFSKSRKWVFRIGAVFEDRRIEYEIHERIGSLSPRTTIYSNGAGWESEPYISANEYTAVSSLRVYRETTTTYHYGLGFSPTEHLQIDVLAFLGTSNNSILDASFYRNLRLSFHWRLP